MTYMHQASRKMAASKLAVIEAQLRDGAVEVAVGSLTSEQLQDFTRKLRAAAADVHIVRLRCLPRGARHNEYLAHESGANSHHPPYLSPSHIRDVNRTSSLVQDKMIRGLFNNTISALLTQSHITELELGMRLGTLYPNGYKMLCAALKKTNTLRRLSFAGSHMGDEALVELQEGLQLNVSIEQLDLTACALTDTSVCCLASVVKAHASRRSDALFSAGLRRYPDTRHTSHTDTLQHELAMRQMVKDVDKTCGGWLLLELALNPLVTDKGACVLRDALSFDKRLVLLTLRGTGLSLRSEQEFASLMKEHQQLARVDLRYCTGQGANRMGILKLHKSQQSAWPGSPPPRTGRVKQPNSPTRTERSLAFNDLLRHDSSTGPVRRGNGATADPVSNTPCSQSWPASTRPCSPLLSPSLSIKRRQQSQLLSQLSWGDARLAILLEDTTTNQPCPTDTIPTQPDTTTANHHNQPPGCSTACPMPDQGPVPASGPEGDAVRDGACMQPQNDNRTTAMHGDDMHDVTCPACNRPMHPGCVPSPPPHPHPHHAEHTGADVHTQEPEQAPSHSGVAKSVQGLHGSTTESHVGTHTGGGHIYTHQGVGVGRPISKGGNRQVTTKGSKTTKRGKKAVGSNRAAAQVDKDAAACASRAAADARVAELAALLRQLDLEVSKAEYQVQLTKEMRATWDIPPPTTHTHNTTNTHHTTHTATHPTYQTKQPETATDTKGSVTAAGKGVSEVQSLIDALAPSLAALGLSVPSLARASHSVTDAGTSVTGASKRVTGQDPSVTMPSEAWAAAGGVCGGAGVVGAVSQHGAAERGALQPGGVHGVCALAQLDAESLMAKIQEWYRICDEALDESA